MLSCDIDLHVIS